MSTAQFLNDRAKAQLNGPWRQGPRITAENLKRGTGPIERVTAEEWFRALGGGKPPAGQPKGAAQPRGDLMGFGKHATLTLTQVRDTQPGYWSWALENVKSFRQRAEKAGLA